MHSSENSGLVKFDILGLNTLTVINKTLEMLETKNKLTNLVNQYRKFNLNSNTVLNQFKIHFNHVR